LNLASVWDTCQRLHKEQALSGKVNLQIAAETNANRAIKFANSSGNLQIDQPNLQIVNYVLQIDHRNLQIVNEPANSCRKPAKRAMKFANSRWKPANRQ
jgi:hypothetical protein